MFGNSVRFIQISVKIGNGSYRPGLPKTGNGSSFLKAAIRARAAMGQECAGCSWQTAVN